MWVAALGLHFQSKCNESHPYDASQAVLSTFDADEVLQAYLTIAQITSLTTVAFFCSLRKAWSCSTQPYWWNETPRRSAFLWVVV